MMGMGQNQGLVFSHERACDGEKVVAAAAAVDMRADDFDAMLDTVGTGNAATSGALCAVSWKEGAEGAVRVEVEVVGG